ncbi:TIGR03943 family protein [Streptomyces sp. Li-HN-5-11]|uniref:TIGR03943 family putative permease subunit n=1 Tax=Streptomyces sp. Li-HN-5-11 TaxID=3075432 RepID=UPI0028B05B90|nr:TIGR03943 family protein [Streptomyces sp. Li-HN-5-11]WNM29141.1 TIGR03943 family protein [Streptomyces sp. Li-HN-5-11]
MNRQAQAAVMFLVGAALLHAGISGLYLRYVKAGLQPLLLGSGVVLVGTALMTLWYERKESKRAKEAKKPKDAKGEAHGDEAHGDETHSDEAHGRQADGHGHAGDGHGHAHREPRISWLLVLPLFALILVAPPALGSYSAVRTGTALQRPYGYTALPAGNPVPLTVVDYAGRAVYDHGRSIAGRRVQVTGFVALDGGGAPYLVRMALSCCAADAQPVKIALTGQIPPVLQPDTWLQVTGTYTPRRTKDPVNDGPIPYLNVIEAKPVPTPHDPYDETWNQ